MTYFFARSLNINKYFCFLYALIFSLLAYTTSGTLYVDNHSSLICLAAVYFFIFGVKRDKKYYFSLIPLLIGFAFFTKPAPTIYIFLFLSVILLLYIFTFQRFKVLFYLVFSSLIFLVFIHLFFYLQNISKFNFRTIFLFSYDNCDQIFKFEFYF